MIKMKYSLLITAYLFIFMSYAQNGFLSGKVLDKQDQSELIGVNIIFGENQGTSTNIDGQYSLELEAGTYAIRFQYIGYQSETLEVTIESGMILKKDIYLTSASTEMDLVVISAGKFEQKLEEVTVSMDVIKPTLIENKNPPDLEVLMNQSPGVQVVDGQANIRGGSGWSYNTGSRVLVMVDDMPILSGDRGTVEWNMIPMENISQIEVIKGASSVLFGSSAMNGVINVRTAYPKGGPESKISLFSGIYDNPERKGLNWWGDNTRRFHGMTFSYAEKKDNTGIVIGGNIYSNDGYKGGVVFNPINDGVGDFGYSSQDSLASNFGQLIPVSEKWGRFNISAEHNSQSLPGLSYGLRANFMALDQYQSLIFTHDSIGYTPVGVPEGDEPVRFTQIMFNIDPFIKYINPNNNTQHSYKARFFRDDYEPYEEEQGYSNVFYQEYQFQKIFDLKDVTFVSNSGLVSNYIKGNYDSIYGEGGPSNIKQLFNYSAYSQLDIKYQRWNISLGSRLEHLIFGEDNYIIPVIRTGVNYQLLEGTYLRSSFGQGYRYPTIMEMFVKTDFHPVYVYANPDLNAEAGWSGEIGIKQLLKIGEWKGMLDFAGFIMHYDDMIEFTFGQWGEINWNDPMSNFLGMGFKCVNIGETRITGFEVSAMGEGKIGPVDIALLASYTKVNPVSLTPDSTYYEYAAYDGTPIYVNYTNASYYTEGNILKYRHENILKFDINLEFANIMTGLSTRYNSLMKNMDYVFGSGLFNAGGGSDGESTVLDLGILESRERMLDGDLILDWRIGYHINEKLSLSFIIDNLLNTEYQTRPADLGPPRTYTVKLSAKI